jgi:hypothetical protein
MGNGRWSRFIGILLAAGCADVTFDLLPPPKEPPDAGGGGDENMGGAPGAPAGTGGASASAGGAGCGPQGCVVVDCHPEDDCYPCKDDRDCEGTGKPLCGGSGRCMQCRPEFECPRYGDCSRDCDREHGERCDWKTLSCAPDCLQNRCDGEELVNCFPDRWVCTECNPDPKSPFNDCPGYLKCNYLGSCGECLSGFDCLENEYEPICSFETWKCRRCLTSEECNWGVPAGSPQNVCDVAGRCVPLGPPPPPPEP